MPLTFRDQIVIYSLSLSSLLSLVGSAWMSRSFAVIHIGILSLATHLIAALAYVMPCLMSLIIPCWIIPSLLAAPWFCLAKLMGVSDAIPVAALAYGMPF